MVYDWNCPHCGAGDSNENDHYLGEGCHWVQCGECEKDFQIAVHVAYTYRVLKPHAPSPTDQGEKK